MDAYLLRWNVAASDLSGTPGIGSGFVVDPVMTVSLMALKGSAIPYTTGGYPIEIDPITFPITCKYCRGVGHRRHECPSVTAKCAHCSSKAHSSSDSAHKPPTTTEQANIREHDQPSLPVPAPNPSEWTLVQNKRRNSTPSTPNRQTDGIRRNSLPSKSKSPQDIGNINNTSAQRSQEETPLKEKQAPLSENTTDPVPVPVLNTPLGQASSSSPPTSPKATATKPTTKDAKVQKASTINLERARIPNLAPPKSKQATLPAPRGRSSSPRRSAMSSPYFRSTASTNNAQAKQAQTGSVEAHQPGDNSTTE